MTYQGHLECLDRILSAITTQQGLIESGKKRDRSRFYEEIAPLARILVSDLAASSPADVARVWCNILVAALLEVSNDPEKRPELQNVIDSAVVGILYGIEFLARK